MNLIKYFIKFSLVFFVLLLLSEKSFSIEPDKFIQSIADEASKVLINNFSKEKKMEKLKAIALKSVDIKGIGLYSLGSHRKNLSDNQKEKYSELFKKYFLKSFSSRLSDYTDPKINVLSMEKLNNKYTIVSSILIATEKNPEVKINWRVYTKDPANPLIRDLIIEGISLARTQKEEFNSVIQSNDGDINALFANLTEFINK
ncbi:MAG: ABC transporter substrate-binding protein [Pelagibacterales bacterium]|nr:ABC transporter substrate-binding protein [Pelagibacterales bacterium]|tara:strand:+ start:43 stop:645 length:603 start_codon:yes stop_codon:yes gene_type:complete